MLSLRSAILCCCLFTPLVADCKTASAFGGYPPFGAWAYGSGSGGYSTGYWGGHHGWGRASAYRVSYRSWGYGGLHCRNYYPRTTFYTSAYYYPAVYVSPVVCAPTYYYQPASYCLPSYSWPSCWSAPTYSVNYVDPLCANTTSLSDNPTRAAIRVSDTSTSARFVASELQLTSPADTTIPAQLLAAADAIMQAGGYRQAATAYAQLNVRYGSSREIFARRFVAQVAAEDWDQAAVVLASAQAAGFQFQRDDLPAGQLAELLPALSREFSRLTEQLAARALSAPDQREALQLMGVWLGLAGDDSRAELFLTMAVRVSTDQSQWETDGEQLVAEELPAPRSKSAYVSVE